MRRPDGPRLGYCTNVHPYTDVAGMLAALDVHATRVRARLDPGASAGSLGVGLWLPADAARAVAADPAPVREHLAQRGLSAFTVNAFPYGAFHGDVVKDAVFRPSWAEPARLLYTLDAARALAGLLGDETVGSVSTHTGAYKPWGPQQNDAHAIAAGLRAAADGLARLEDETGKCIVLALEPEPLSFLETTDEVVAFFERHLPRDEPRLARHVGVCWDACHQSVEYEDAHASLARLRAAGIVIAKAQLTCAIVVPDPRAAQEALRPYAEDRWFHQVVARGADGRLVRSPDLPDALADPALLDAAEWRVHFHVPLFADRLDEAGLLRTTRDELAALVDLLADGTITPHLEVETYSFAMIPQERRDALGVPTVTDGIAADLAWVRERLGRGA